MPRKVKFIPVASRLSQILTSLKSDPRPYLNKLKGLKITYAYRNDHWGTKHFVKNDLPRIRYANPKLEIEVKKLPKTKEDTWKPELTLQLRDGTTRSVDVDNKWSSTIFQEVMEIGGGPAWERWKAERTAAGLPLVEVPRPKAKAASSKSSQKKSIEVETPELPDFTKAGAAAVLP